MTMEQIVIVIPAYEPDRRLITLLTNLKQNHVGFVVLVDDGSGDGYKEIFQEAELLMENLFGGGMAFFSHMTKIREKGGR